MGGPGSGNRTNPNSLKNLNMSHEHMKAIAPKGVAKLRENCARRKTFKEVFNTLLSEPAFKTESEIVERCKELKPELDNREAMAIAITYKAIKEGDPKAFAVIRDTTGELPAQTVNVQTEEPMQIVIKTVE